jgi:lipoyl(octanoyl) transferase
VTPDCLIVDLGFLAYAEACALQERVVASRKAGTIDDVLLLCQHPHVITLGRNAKREHLLASDSVLQQKGVEVHHSSRGGDITYHGPGQLIAYPVLNLAAIRRDVGWYVRMLEEVMIRTAADYGISALREPGKTGVWVETDEGHSALATRHSFTPDLSGPLATSEKLGAIGVHLSRWITSHGLAFNVSTDLRYFDLIVPCGIHGRKATSLEKLLGGAIDLHEAVARLTRHFSDVFGRSVKSCSRDDFQQKLEQSEEAVAAHV